MFNLIFNLDHERFKIDHLTLKQLLIFNIKFAINMFIMSLLFSSPIILTMIIAYFLDVL